MAVKAHKSPPPRLSIMTVSFSLRYQRSLVGGEWMLIHFLRAAVAESRDGVFIFLQGLANCAVQ